MNTSKNKNPRITSKDIQKQPFADVLENRCY